MASNYRFQTAALICLPLSDSDAKKFRLKPGGDAENQSLRLEDAIRFVLNRLQPKIGEVAASVCLRRYFWQVKGEYFIFLSSQTPEAAAFVHGWLEKLNSEIEGVILPFTWEVSESDPLHEPVPWGSMKV